MSDLFKQYPNMSQYFTTSDGTPFFKEETARTHARTLKNNKVETVDRPDEQEEIEETKPENAKEIISKSLEMDLETAQEYLTAEESLELPRSTVVTALKKRIAELETPGE